MTVREHFENSLIYKWNLKEYWDKGFKGQGIKVANFEYCYDKDHGQNVAETVKTYAPECELVIWPKIKDVSPMSDNGENIVFPEFAKWCIDNKVDIITSSLDWTADKEVEKEWVKKLYDAGIIFCNCAGNESSNIKLEKGDKANRIDKGIVCVGSCMFSATDKITYSNFSNYGTAVDVIGIGSGTPVLLENGNMYSWSGTSAATPFIAGLLATYKSYDKSLNSNNVMELFEKSHIKLTYKDMDYKVFILPEIKEGEIKMEENKNEASSWAKEAWEKAIKLGVTDGTNPQGAITREQVIVMLDRLGLLK